MLVITITNAFLKFPLSPTRFVGDSYHQHIFLIAIFFKFIITNIFGVIVITNILP